MTNRRKQANSKVTTVGLVVVHEKKCELLERGDETCDTLLVSFIFHDPLLVSLLPEYTHTNILLLSFAFLGIFNKPCVLAYIGVVPTPICPT
jgi:hypothetical protein